MIWNEVTPLECSRLALREHVAETLRALSPDPATTPAWEDVADGVALFCLQAERTTLLSDDFIALALARALHGVGLDGLAERVVARERAPGRSLEQYLPLVRAGARSPGLWRSCASGVIRPTEIAAVDGRSVWVVDTTRLEQGQSEILELTMLTVLQTVLDAVVPLWDESGGRGALALLSGSPRAGRASSVDEWLAYCRDVLGRHARARNWPRVPRVLRLDLPRGGRKRRVLR